MKGIIIYKGKYGATRQYAEWLSEKLLVPALYSDDISKEQLEAYDFIVLGSSVYIGKLQLSSWLDKHAAILHRKKIFLFVVSATPGSEKEKLEGYITSSVPASLAKKIDCHFLRGKLVIKELSWLDRFLLKMGARMAKDPVEKKKMLTDFNDVRVENLAELISEIEQFSNSRTILVSQPLATELEEYF